MRQGAEPLSSRVSPNINVGPDCYTNEVSPWPTRRRS